MMILPENGSVVVIDDDPNQAGPIIDALAKKGIATTYFKGTGEKEVPNEPLNNVRLAILDLQLNPMDNDGHTIATRLVSVLNKVISDNNGPFMVVIWSLKNDLFGEEFRNEVMKQSNSRVPVCIATLEKTKCLQRSETNNALELADSVIEEMRPRLEENDLEIIKSSIINNFKEDEQFEATPNAIEVIEKSLKSALEKAGVFHLFVIWENLIRKAGYQTVNDVSTTIDYTNLWEMNMRDVLKRMAKARTGQNTLPDDLTLKSSLFTFSGSFIEELEYEIRKKKLPDYIKLESPFSIASENGGLTYKINVSIDNKGQLKGSLLKGDDRFQGLENVKLNELARKINLPEENEEKQIYIRLAEVYSNVPFLLNTRLHLELEPAVIHIPGNVYKIDVTALRKKEILSTYIDTIPDDVSDYYFIELEVSPVCDYAQKKWKKSRLLSGLVSPVSSNIKSGEYFYRNSPIISFDNKKYRMTFCYLIFKSHDVKEVEGRGKPWFRIKRELMQDIVAGLSGHVNRPGITLIP